VAISTSPQVTARGLLGRSAISEGAHDVDERTGFGRDIGDVALS
jgi:hypothetical protein